jgi:ABC-type polysaccharide/polyol phosphate export permease
MLAFLIGVLQGLLNFLRTVLEQRRLILALSIRNFKSSFLGSALGITWVIIEPLIYVFLLWFFFTKAMKVPPPENVEFVPWLMTAMAIWNFFSLTFSTSVTTFKNYSYLLKRPQFDISILPIVNILSSIYVHVIFLLLLIIVLLAGNIKPSFFWLQSIYYLFATCILLLGLSWITASISLFLKDVGNIVSVLVQIGFWISPIFWSLNSFPPKFRFLLELNPLSYILEGYRKSFLFHEPIWLDLSGAVYFWSITIVILFFGAITFKKLRPHFGDVI